MFVLKLSGTNICIYYDNNEEFIKILINTKKNYAINTKLKLYIIE